MLKNALHTTELVNIEFDPFLSYQCSNDRSTLNIRDFI